MHAYSDAAQHKEQAQPSFLRNHLALHVPLTKHSEQESTRIGKWHCQRELYSSISISSPEHKKKDKDNIPCFPTRRKNHTLPVKLTTSGIEYAGVRSRFTTVQKTDVIFARNQDC